VDGRPEPVRRFFAHALPAGVGPGRMRVRMRGRVRAGAWLPFSAEQVCDDRSFEWLARVRLGPLTLLRVTDSFADGLGHTEGRLFGAVRLFGASDEDTARSAAGRAALEAVVFAPGAARAADWTALSDHELLARFDLPPERPEVHVRIDAEGALRSITAARWGNPGGDGFDYVPCGCDVHAERRFGDLVIPSRLTVSWWHGTPRAQPFFEADVDSAVAD
jgi:uncharacterized protein DUF6544